MDVHAWMLLAAGLAEMAIGVLVVWVAPRQSANQFLGTILIVEGLFPMGVVQAFRHSAPGDPLVVVGARVTSIALVSFPLFYLLFVGQTLRVPATAWLRRAAVMWGILAIFVLLAVSYLLFGEIVTGVGVLLMVAVGSYAFVAAILNFRRAQGAARRRARTYLVAFGLRDLTWIAMGIAALAVNVGGALGAGPILTWLRVGFLVSDLFMVHALLRGQILAIDHTLARAAGAATALALLGGAFVLATESLEEAFRTSSELPGMLVALALAATFAPLHRWVSARLVLVLGLKPLAAMDAAEREAAYREQLELAWEDGAVTPKEERMLAHMAARLGVEPGTGRPLSARGRSGVGLA